MTLRRNATAAFLVASISIVVAFLLLSSSMAREVARQEKERMEIWAQATRQIIAINSDDGSSDDGNQENMLGFLLGIIESNTSIPVMLTDDSGMILMHRNITLPEPADSTGRTSAGNAEFLQRKLNEFQSDGHVIHILISPSTFQHLYYQDSRMLKALNVYPYVMVAVLAAFMAVVYFAAAASRRAEQNKVWVGLSKETAHQLGTPISSLMAWVELMREMDLDPEIVNEIDKDVRRLGTIASRFSKIGSRPAMEPADLRDVISQAVDYMATRISSNICMSLHIPDHPLVAPASVPLLQWVMENLIKNSVDAMDGHGKIDIVMRRDGNMAVITVTDTGRGIPRKDFRKVFMPGHTTKKRGWGLGLALARRIIRQYHGGTIIVSRSDPGKATTFEIKLPLTKENT